MTTQAVPRTGHDKTARHDFDKARPSLLTLLFGPNLAHRIQPVNKTVAAAERKGKLLH
jgi:hypothetical protein